MAKAFQFASRERDRGGVADTANTEAVMALVLKARAVEIGGIILSCPCHIPLLSLPHPLASGARYSSARGFSGSIAVPYSTSLAWLRHCLSEEEAGRLRKWREGECFCHCVGLQIIPLL